MAEYRSIKLIRNGTEYTTPSCFSSGNEFIKLVRNGTEYCLPKDVYIEFLLVGGGGAGGRSHCISGGGGGGGGIVYCSCYLLDGSKCVVIGAGGAGGTGYTYFCGKKSCFGDIVAFGGGAGGPSSGSSAVQGAEGGSGGGGNGYSGKMGLAFQGQGKNGGSTPSFSYSASGGGGRCKEGCQRYSCYCGGCGGCGYYSNITGSNMWYSSGGGGGSRCNMSNGICGGGKGGYDAAPTGCAATTYGSGGGGAGYSGAGICCAGGAGCQGIFVARYPTACNYNITGGCKYTSGTYTVHCFTSNGTLTLN